MRSNLKCTSALALLLLVGVAHAARADTLGTPTVLYSQSSLVTGSDPSVTTLNVPGAGELFLTLTDLSFPTPFASLKFALTNSQTALVGLADPGTLTLDLTQPTQLYAEVFDMAADGPGMGLYNLTATFLSSSPVPLPASGLLFASGLLMLLLAPLAAWIKRSEWVRVSI